MPTWAGRARARSPSNGTPTSQTTWRTDASSGHAWTNAREASTRRRTRFATAVSAPMNLSNTMISYVNSYGPAGIAFPSSANAPNVNHRPESLTVGDFLTTEVPRLENVRETWLDEPDPELYGRTPRSIIDRERARLPEEACGHDLIVDPDCPCCQMIGDLPGPSFWHLDGSSMDNDFAFDIYCRTREEWEEEQQAWDDYAERCDAERSDREPQGVTDSEPPTGGLESSWSGSLSTADVSELPLGVRLFGVGCHLAELIVGLRSGADRESTPPEAQRHINQLNRDFGNLRDVLQNDDSSLADALIDPVLRRFGETLETVAVDRPDVAAQCERVACDLARCVTRCSAGRSGAPTNLTIPFDAGGLSFRRRNDASGASRPLLASRAFSPQAIS